MLIKDIDQITVADLEALVENRIPEGRTLEYKRDHYGRKDEDKREFAADISAFANASGGDLLIGISEVEGVASEVVGIEHDNPDKLILAVRDSIRTSLEPQIVGVRVRWIEIDKDRGVLVVRVPKSWSAPHRVVVAKDSRFYLRDENGKHPMSVEELRSSFSLLADLEKRVRDFREERLQLLTANEGPLGLPEDNPILVFHFIPMRAFTERTEIEFKPNDVGISPFGSSGHNLLYSIDGLVAHSGHEESLDTVRAFTTFFRNGIVEAAGRIFAGESAGRKFISLVGVEKYLIGLTRKIIPEFERRNILGPYYLLVSVVGIQGFCTSPNDFRMSYPFRGRRINLPVLEVQSNLAETSAHILLKPLIDLLWNAFGCPDSPSYTESGGYSS